MDRNVDLCLQRKFAVECEHIGFVFTVPDEWWQACGVSTFVPQAASYRAGEISNARQAEGRVTVIVPLIDIEPVRDFKRSHGVFNDLPNKSAEARVCEIFRGFKKSDAIPPIEILPTAAGAAQRYRLYHGAHRFHCSIAAGFTLIPAIDVS